GATGASYLLGAADVGFTLRVTVTASNGAGTASATSVPTATVQATSTAPSTAGIFTFGSWEGATKTSEFSDSTCHSDRITLQSTTVREGTNAATWSADTSVHCYNDTSN